MSCGATVSVGPTFFLESVLSYLIAVDVKIGRGPVLRLTRTPMPPNGADRSRDNTAGSGLSGCQRPPIQGDSDTHCHSALEWTFTSGKEGAALQTRSITSFQDTLLPTQHIPCRIPNALRRLTKTMASPPNYAHSPTATSPPYQSSHVNMGKKRAASDIASNPPTTLKRRKASNLSISSTSAHPLRQTSFPPEAADGRRSPSVDDASVVSGSAVSAPAKKKRGRKAKGAEPSSKEATPSLVGGKGGGTPGDKEKEQEEEDDEDANAMQMEGAQSEEQKNEERRLRGVLAQALDRVQYDRYEKWRGLRLPEAPVRRVSSII